MVRIRSNCKYWVGLILVFILGIGIGALLRSDATSHQNEHRSSHSATLSNKGSSADPNSIPEGLVGVVLAEQAADIAPQISGRLTAVRVRLGDTVSAGAVLAILDDRLLRRNLTEAEAALRASEAALERARGEQAEASTRWERRNRAAEHLSIEEVETAKYADLVAKAKLEESTAQVEQQRSRVAELKEQIALTILRAPFDGAVSARYMNSGVIVSEHTAVVRLIGRSQPYLRFAVPKEFAAVIKVSQPLRINIETLSTSLSGSVLRIAPEVDPAAGMIFAEAGLVVPEALKDAITVGMIARVFLDTTTGSGFTSGIASKNTRHENAAQAQEGK